MSKRVLVYATAVTYPALSCPPPSDRYGADGFASLTLTTATKHKDTVTNMEIAGDKKSNARSLKFAITSDDKLVQLSIEMTVASATIYTLPLRCVFAVWALLGFAACGVPALMQRVPLGVCQCFAICAQSHACCMHSPWLLPGHVWMHVERCARLTVCNAHGLQETGQVLPAHTPRRLIWHCIVSRAAHVHAF